MAPKKTQAELDEEERQKQQSSGFMDTIGNLMPWNWPWGSILIGTVVVGALFLGLRNEKVQEFIGKLFDGDTPGSGKDKVAGVMNGIGAWVSGNMPWLAKLLHIENAVGNILDGMTAEQARAKLPQSPYNMDPALVGAIAADQPTWEAFKTTVKTANGGQINSKDDVLNDKTIYAFLTSDKPEVKTMVDKLLPAMLTQKKPGTALSDEEKKSRNIVLAAMRSIVSDSRLDTLLNATNAPRTYALLATVAGTTASRLQAQMSVMLGADRKPTPLLRSILTAQLTPTDDGQLPSAEQAFADAKKQAATDPTLKAQVAQAETSLIQTALKDPNAAGVENAKAYAALKQTCGDDQLVSLVTQAAANPDQTQTLVMGNFKLFSAFKTFADSANVDKLPSTMDGMKAPIAQLQSFPKDALLPVFGMYRHLMAGSNDSKQALNDLTKLQTMFGDSQDTSSMLQPLFNAENRALLTKASLKNVASYIVASQEDKLKRDALANLVTAENLAVILKTAEKIGKRSQVLDQQSNQYFGQQPTAALGNLPSKTSLQVIDSMVSFVNGKADALMNPPSETIAAFFRDDTYRDAVRDLLKDLKLPGAKGQALALINQHWGDKEKGIAALLSDTDSVAFIKEHAAKPKDALDKTYGGLRDMVDVFTQGGKIRKFKDDLQALSDAQHIMDGTNLSPQATPTKAASLAFRVAGA